MLVEEFKGLTSELKEELVGKEMSFTDLDNYLVSKGFYSVFDDGITSNIKQDRNVVYQHADDEMYSIIIEFDITTDNAEDEAEENFYMKVNSVEIF